MGNSTLVKCKDSRIDCLNRTVEGRCKILCNTEFTNKDGSAKTCTFYKTNKQGTLDNDI